MKNFLSGLVGKLVVGIGSVCVVTAVVVTVIMVTKNDDYRTIKVEELTGQSIICDADNMVQDAYSGMNLEDGDKVEVQADSNMTLLLDMDKYMFADAGTKFRLEATGNIEKSTTKTKIVLEEGSVLCRLDSKLGDDEVYQVETPNSVMSVRGTILKVSIFESEDGKKYTQLDVLEGSVKIEAYMENGEKAEDEGIVEAGQSALVHSDPSFSEFVIGESNITYEDFSGPMAEFVVETIDDGRQICIGESLFIHYTGLEDHPETFNVTKEPTCVEDGEEEIYCSTCDAVVGTRPIEATGEHTFGEWEVTTEADCEAAGAETRKCDKCEMTETREVAATGHSYGTWSVTTQASCEATGVETRICSECGNAQTRTVAATGHSYGNWTLVSTATCTTGGSEQRTCSKCNTSETRGIAATGHSYGEWTTTQQPDCENTGIQQRVCSKCSATETQQIAALGHSYGEWEILVEATCKEVGEQMRVCTECNYEDTQEIAALGHLWPEGEGYKYVYHVVNGAADVLPNVGDTIEVYGYVTCIRVGCTVSSDENHTMSGTVLEAGTDIGTNNGVANFSCSCGYVYSEYDQMVEDGVIPEGYTE